MYGGSWSDLLAGKLQIIDALMSLNSLCYTGTGNKDVRLSKAFPPETLIDHLS